MSVDLRRDFVTPEGVPITFQLAQAGDRAAAFVIDFLILFVSLILGFFLISSLGGQSIATPILLVMAFFIQNFYFPFFEVRWQGSTPGKRSVGIRVIDARGGELTVSAVIARNLVRSIEVWIPLALIVAPQSVWPDAPGWMAFLASAWAIVFMLMPLFNKDRLRIGDMVGGTRVVRTPRALLLTDVADEKRRDIIEFTEAQLAIYGIYELQVLEGILRAVPISPDAIATVYERITKKIKWKPPELVRVDQERFLRDFYAALRAHLERKALFGKRKEDKFAK